MVPLGFEANKFQFSSAKEDIALTVGALNESNLKRKGMNSFFDLARHFPETQFWTVGEVDALTFSRIRNEVPRNVKVVGRVTDEVLRDIFRRAKVYVQLSAHEGFGSAVAEAMLSGCIALVSDRGALPEVVDGAGSIVPYGDMEAARHALKEALGAGIRQSVLSRERIVNEYPIETRRRALVDTVGFLIAEFYGRR